MMGHDPKSRVTTITVFLLPLLLIKGAAILLGGGGPEEVGGSPITVEVPHIPPPPVPTWTDEQRAAAEHMAYLRTQPFTTSPLFHERPAAGPDQTEQPTVVEPPPIVLEPPPRVRVRAILTARGGTDIALIGRRQYRVGDRIGKTGWFVSEINSQTRSVTLHHPETDRTVSLPVPLPR